MSGITQDPGAWARLGGKIREQRERLGMSRRQLSEAAGVSEKSIQVAEEGRTPRARWPQSLRLIEAALGWEPGSMVSILEGGEPEPNQALFSIINVHAPSGLESTYPTSSPSDRHESAQLSGDGIPTNHARSVALAGLPGGLRKALPDVLEFGRKAASYGADPEVVERYEEGVEQLILSLVAGPREYVGPSGNPSHLGSWMRAMRMDPVLRRQAEEQRRLVDRELRRSREIAEKYRLFAEPAEPSLGDEPPSRSDVDALAAVVQRLTEEVARVVNKLGIEDDSDPQ